MGQPRIGRQEGGTPEPGLARLAQSGQGHEAGLGDEDAVSVGETDDFDAVHAADRFGFPLVAFVKPGIHQFRELGIGGHPPFVSQFHVGDVVFHIQLGLVVNRSGRWLAVVFRQILIAVSPLVGCPVIHLLGLRFAPGVVIAGLLGLGGAHVEGCPRDRQPDVDGGRGGDVISVEGQPCVLVGDGAETGAMDGERLVQRNLGEGAVQFGIGDVQSLGKRSRKEGGEVVLPGDETAFWCEHGHRGVRTILRNRGHDGPALFEGDRHVSGQRLLAGRFEGHGTDPFVRHAEPRAAAHVIECHQVAFADAHGGECLVGESPFFSLLDVFDRYPHMIAIEVVVGRIRIHRPVTGDGAAAVSGTDRTFEGDRRLRRRVRRSEYPIGRLSAEDGDLLLRGPPDACPVGLDGRPGVGIVGPGGLERHFLRKVDVLLAGAGQGGRQEQRATDERQVFHGRPPGLIVPPVVVSDVFVAALPGAAADDIVHGQDNLADRRGDILLPPDPGGFVRGDHMLSC